MPFPEKECRTFIHAFFREIDAERGIKDDPPPPGMMNGVVAMFKAQYDVAVKGKDVDQACADFMDFAKAKGRSERARPR